MSFNMYLPTRTLFGAGMLNELHKQPLPDKKALLLISNGKSVQETGSLARTEEQMKLAKADYVIFAKVGANPLKSVERYRQGTPVQRATGSSI